MIKTPADLVVLCPTRCRPHSVVDMAFTLAATCAKKTWFIWCVDGDDYVGKYTVAYHSALSIYPWQLMRHGPRRHLVGTLNHYTRLLCQADEPPTAIAYLGDDHRPETTGWDSAFIAALNELGTGLVYGDDGLQHQNLPTAVAMTTNIARALGYFAPPVLEHLYCDNFWKDLGEGAGCLSYLPDVRITHHHPAAGKGTWDASYAETNSARQDALDSAAYQLYRDLKLHHDITTVAALKGTS